MNEAMPTRDAVPAAVSPTPSTTLPLLPYLVVSSSNPNLATVASLNGIGLPDQISVPLPPPSFPSNPVVENRTTSVDAAMAASAGFPGLVNVNASANATYIIWELRSSVDRAGRPGSLILKETWGYAYRMCVKAWGIKGNVDLNSIAATCTTNVTTAGSAFQVQVLGIPAANLVNSITAISTLAMGRFDMSQMAQLGVIQKRLTSLILDPSTRGLPELLSVDVDISKLGELYTNSPSTMLGLSGIAQGYTQPQTLAKQPKSSALPPGMAIDPSVVADVYTAMGVGSTGTPSAVEKATALQQSFRHSDI